MRPGPAGIRSWSTVELNNQLCVVRRRRRLPYRRRRIESLAFVNESTCLGHRARLWLRVVFGCLAAVAVASTAVVAADDADTLTVGGTRYRLDGIDAPETDQTCLDEKGERWPCGREAYARLLAFVKGRPITCRDVGADTVYGRRVGQCTVDETDLNRWLVREGLAINFEPYAKGRFLADQAEAQAKRAGMWAGCFVAPRNFRRWEKRNAVMLGSRCPKDARNILFPDHPDMPPGCDIKGNFTVRAWPNRGIYHVQGCRSYQRLANPQRWFCSEDDAKAAKFRRAYNCPR